MITSYKYVRNLMILFKIERFDKIILRKIMAKINTFPVHPIFGVI